MKITKHDGILWMYNAGVVLSGSYVVWEVDLPDRFAMVIIAIIFGLFWTIYFRFAMIPRLVDHPLFQGDPEDGSVPSQDE